MQRFSLASLAALLLATAIPLSVIGSPLTFLSDRAEEEAEEQAVMEENEIERDMIAETPVIVTQSRQPTKGKSRFPTSNKEWLQMSLSPPGAFSAPIRSRIELECEAIGSPTPQIHWLKGADPLRQLGELMGNSVAEVDGLSTPWGGLGRTRSRLVIDCTSPRDQGLIHCAAVSGSRTILSKPTMLLINELSKGNSSGCGLETRPRVTLYSPLVMAPIGATVALPCRASGRPRPHTIWIDNEERPITPSSNPRYKVLGSGELVIYPLKWSDMGGFICIARSDRDEDASTTFLYPILDKESQS